MEGKLSASEAAVVRAELAASDADAIESFADAAAVVQEIGLVADGKATPRGRHQRSILGWSMLGVLAAAALVAAVVRTIGRADESFDVNRLITPLPITVSAPVTDAWLAVRGGADDLSPDVRAARLGASIVDFELAMRAGDTLSARQKAGAVAALGDGLAGAGPFVAQYRAISSGNGFPASRDTTRNRFNDALASVAGRDWVMAGASAELLRAAAESRDASAVTALCEQSKDFAKNLLIPSPHAAASIGDSLRTALAERPCRRERVGALSAALLTAITR
jgi:hypothetical protein